MDELILENLNEETTEQEQEFNLATIGTVSTSGVTLIFDGQDAATSKIYKVNSTVQFSAGDRVRIKKDSGTYLVEFPIGTPMERYPIPSGGSSGQVLAKSSNDDYAIGWVDAAHGIPTGGTAGQVLAKSSNNYYAVSWVDAAHGLPMGGTTGQVLAKSSNTNYAVEWTTVSAAQIKNGSYTLAMSSAGVLEPSSTSVHLGSSTKIFGNLYAQGVIYLGNSYSGEVHIGAASGSKLSFFGHTASARQTVASSATVATLITALKAYGLIN